MKKFNPEKELQKIQERGKNENNSRLSNMYVPLLVIACSCLAMAGITFSANLANDSKKEYTVRIDIINGDEDTYVKTVKEGAFSDTITSLNSFGSIECTSGNLSYNAETNTISSPYIDRNTSCVLSFMDDVVKKIEYGNLNSVVDNTGVSYYYPADASDNYIKIKDMMFRIVRINGDGTYRIILNDSVLNSSYNSYISYMESDMKKVLDDWFNVNFSNESYVVLGGYDITNYVDLDINNLVNIEGYAYVGVGTLSAREVALITKDSIGESYFSKGSGMYLMNVNGADKVYAYIDGQITGVSPETTLGLKPVINVSGELEGLGTESNPYILK